jgi:hypothetical protein
MFLSFGRVIKAFFHFFIGFTPIATLFLNLAKIRKKFHLPRLCTFDSYLINLVISTQLF